METSVACVCVRAAFGCAAELWRNLLPSTIAIRIRFAALRVSRCGHRLYKTMFGFPSGACYVCGELGVAKCRASRSSEHACKGKCSRSLCFLLFVFVCMLVCTWVAGARPDLAPSVLSFWHGFLPHAADPEPPTPQAIRRSARTSPGTTPRKRLTPLQKKKVGAWARWRCQLCGGELTYTYEVDHIRPVSRGRTNDFSNLRALCRECHGKVSLAAVVR